MKKINFPSVDRDYYKCLAPERLGNVVKTDLINSVVVGLF